MCCNPYISQVLQTLMERFSVAHDPPAKDDSDSDESDSDDNEGTNVCCNVVSIMLSR